MRWVALRYAAKWFPAGALVGLVLWMSGAPLWIPILYGAAASMLGGAIWIAAWRKLKRKREQEIDELFETLKRKAHLGELRGD